MTRKPDITPAREDIQVLEEVSLAALEAVSGGCASCGSSNGSGSQITALLPLLLANQNRRR